MNWILIIFVATAPDGGMTSQQVEFWQDEKSCRHYENLYNTKKFDQNFSYLTNATRDSRLIFSAQCVGGENVKRKGN